MNVIIMGLWIQQMKLKIDKCVKKLYIEYIRCLVFLLRIERKNKRWLCIGFISAFFLVSAPKTIPSREKQFHSLNASENYLTENEKKDNGIFFLWLSWDTASTCSVKIRNVISGTHLVPHNCDNTIVLMKIIRKY